MQKLQIHEKPTRSLRAHPRNVHVHPKKQIRLLIRLIRRFGFAVPIIIDETGVILAGHGRWLASQELGLEAVPVIVLSGLSETEKRTFLLADNKAVEKAGWDRAALALELNTLAPLLIEAGLDISLTGFEFVSHMRSKGIVRGELFGNHAGGLFTKTLLSINRGKFSKFGVR